MAGGKSHATVEMETTIISTLRTLSGLNLNTLIFSDKKLSADAFWGQIVGIPR